MVSRALDAIAVEPVAIVQEIVLEIAQCLLEDYAKNRGFDRDRLLLACVQHTAGHRKYGDFLECSRRYGAAMGVASLG